MIWINGNTSELMRLVVWIKPNTSKVTICVLVNQDVQNQNSSNKITQSHEKRVEMKPKLFQSYC